MKNYKLIFYSESIFVIGLLYLFFYASFHQYLSGIFLQVATIISSVIGIINVISIIILVTLGVRFNNLEALIKDKKNPAGVIIRYFGYYLILAFTINFIIFVMYGTESEFAQDLLFMANFILLAPFALIGVVKGFLVAGKM